jgi:hypothetical protein
MIEMKFIIPKVQFAFIINPSSEWLCYLSKEEKRKEKWNRFLTC